MTLRDMTWMNEPPSWKVEGDRLTATSGAETDFWQGTYYGYRTDSGHFFHAEREGDFTLEATFSGRYETLYDQAGLMIRRDAATWMKCGVELTDGALHFSVVVTVGQSDWSAFEIGHAFKSVTTRVTRNRDALFIQYRTDAMQAFRMARLAYFPPELETVSAGLMFCSPKRAGFEATFAGVALTEPVSRDIH